MDSKAIMKTIKESFCFLLEERGCQLVSEEDDDFGVFVTYTSRKAGLRVSYEPREGGVFVMIFPLRDGEIPEYRDWYDVLDFLTAEGKLFEEPRIQRLDNPDSTELRKTVEAYAREIREHLGDYLEGDFSITPKLDAIVNRRREEF